jgi:hypothetical protein
MRLLAKLPWALLSLSVASLKFAQQPLDLSGQWQHQFGASDRDGSPCTISRISAFEQAQGPVGLSTSPDEHPESPKLSAINSTAWEQWEFDGVAASGKGSIMMGFVRDPSFPFFRQGNLRIEFYITLEDGTQVQKMEFAEHSTIIDCPGSVRGIWNTSDSFHAFKVSKDMRSANVWWETQRDKGAFALESHTPPVLANGAVWPLGEGRQAQGVAAVQVSPRFYFNQPISGGKMTAHVQIGKKRMHMTGYGAHCRLWAEDGWFKLCRGWQLVRGYLGPYTVSYFQCLSRVDDWVAYFTAQLFKNGQLLVGTQVGPADGGADHVIFRPDSGGNVTGRLGDKSTGRVLEFVSPARGKTWRFRNRHESKMFEMGFGGGKGATAFVDNVGGGEVGTNEHYEGRGITEQVLLPEEVKVWQMWVLYGISVVGGWKQRLESFVSSIL